MAWKEEKYNDTMYWILSSDNKTKVIITQRPHVHHTGKMGVFRGAMFRGFTLISDPSQASTATNLTRFSGLVCFEKPQIHFSPSAFRNKRLIKGERCGGCKKDSGCHSRRPKIRTKNVTCGSSSSEQSVASLHCTTDTPWAFMHASALATACTDAGENRAFTDDGRALPHWSCLQSSK